MGSMSGPKQSGTQTVTNETKLPEWLDSRYQTAAQLAENQYNQGLTPQKISQTPFSAQTATGMNNMMSTSQSGVSDEAFKQYNSTLQGDYLHGGQGFDAAQQAASNRIIPQVTSAFNSSGRMGGGAGQSELTRQLGDSFAGLYDNERQRYDNERQRQMGALSMAPQMDTLAYEPARRQMQVGMMQDAKNMENTQISDTNRMAQENIQGDTLDQYLTRLGVISPQFGSSSSTRPVYSQGGGFGQLLGAGLGIAGMVTGNPWLGLRGSAGGGLLGGSNTAMGYAPKPQNLLPRGGGY